MGIKIGSKKVGGGKLGAFAEELGTGLEVGDTAVVDREQMHVGAVILYLGHPNFPGYLV
jgi:hypothetical protein